MLILLFLVLMTKKFIDLGDSEGGGWLCLFILSTLFCMDWELIDALVFWLKN